MNIALENFDVDEFKIARIHAKNAFDELIYAQNLLDDYQQLRQTSQNETFKDKLQNAGVTDSQIRSLQEQAFRHLSKAVILYQSSIEAILALAESHDKDLSSELMKINGFKNKWEKALKHFKEPNIEFQKYETDFYEELRIPLTHLTPHRDVRIKKSN